MADADRPRRRGSITGPIILICIGIIFLIGRLRPDFYVWPVLARYWPLILIAIGLGHLWDYYWSRSHPDAGGPYVSGSGIAWILLLLVLIAVAWHGRTGWAYDRPWHGHYHWGGGHEQYSTEAVELQGAKSVTANLGMPAGTLEITGGAPRLLDADFRYDNFDGKPSVDYHVSGTRGDLDVTQAGDHTNFGRSDNDWRLRFGGDVPLDLQLNMGAGETNMRMAGLNLGHLEIHMGAGELHLDLTGIHTNNLEASIEGGAGAAVVRLPKDIGVHVEASGGIGEVDAHGLQRDGDAYVNAAYGKTPASIDLTVHGGVGQIELIGEQ